MDFKFTKKKTNYIILSLNCLNTINRVRIGTLTIIHVNRQVVMVATYKIVSEMSSQYYRMFFYNNLPNR